MFNTRIEKLQSNLQNSEAMLIFGNANRLYFTGFNSSAGVLAVTRNKAVLFIDFRYFGKAKQNVTSAEVLLYNKLYADISDFFKKEKIKTVFFETDSLSFSTYIALKANLGNFEISDDGTQQNFINKLRSIKSNEEIKLIKQAQKLTDDTFSYILNRISKERTEKEIALDMEFFIRKNGGEGVAFDFIVVSGKNSSLPHGVPTDKKIADGDFITMDFGTVVGGYRSDMTRTVALTNVTEKQKLVYNTALHAQTVALKNIKPNAVCKDIDAVARNIIYSAGFEGCFGHGLGHSVGIEIHENPSFNTRDNTVLQSGIVITVEPGIYLENEFGVRIEDMVVVTESSYENLTASPKELIII